MDDTDVLSVDRRRVRLFQRGHGLVDLGRRQHASGVHAASYCHLGMFAGRGVHLVAELLHRAAHNLVSHHLVNAHAAGRAEFFGRAENRVVNRVQFQQIGDRDVQTLLYKILRHARHAELLAGRDDALGQRLRLRQRVPLAPFHALAVVARQCLFLRQLREDEFRTRILQELRVVEGFHCRRQLVGRVKLRLCAVVCVHVVAGRVDQRARIRVKLESDVKHSSFPPSAQRTIFSPL